MSPQHFAIYLAVGAFAGLLAGLLGVGGGLVIVPILVFTFIAQDVPYQHLQHLALGTSLATIAFTSVASLRAHHAKGAVDWATVRSIAPGIVAGTFGGAWVAAWLSTQFLKVFFVLFVYWVCAQMLLDIKPKASRQLPGWLGMSSAGLTIGAVSSLVGIGGGSLSVPFMTWCNVPMHRAIGTSAAIGLPIALAGALGYLTSGWQAPGLPTYAIGFIHGPATLGIVLASVITAPIGARLAHRLPVKTLKRVFAVILLVVGTRMLMTLWSRT